MIVARYRDVHHALEEYFAEPSDSFFHERALELRNTKGGTKWSLQDKNLSADALLACADIIELIDTNDVKIVPPPKSSDTHPMMLAGVRVSVRPEFLILDSAGMVCGGLKFSFNKQQPLSEEGCEFVATLVRAYLVEQYGVGVEHKRCLSISTPTKQVVFAPKASKARMTALQAACEEIAIRWKSLEIDLTKS